MIGELQEMTDKMRFWRDAYRKEHRKVLKGKGDNLSPRERVCSICGSQFINGNCPNCDRPQ